MVHAIISLLISKALGLLSVDEGSKDYIVKGLCAPTGLLERILNLVGLVIHDGLCDVFL